MLEAPARLRHLPVLRRSGVMFLQLARIEEILITQKRASDLLAWILRINDGRT